MRSTGSTVPIGTVSCLGDGMDQPKEIKPFVMSIETTHMVSHRHGFHLGTDLAVAMKICEETYDARVKSGLPVVTVALIGPDDNIWDVYDGRWYDETYQDENTKPKEGDDAS